jgi:NAD(P)-dependent dehydrogenase (short-subunit alcohol dehydrogenase family)
MKDAARRLAGKVAIVTGAAGGIGRATAELFVAEGARVVMTDRDGELLAAAAAPLGHAAVCVVGDVVEPATAERAVAVAMERFGGLHVLFANAGMEGRVAPLVDQQLDDVERVLRVNVLGVFLFVKHAAPRIAESGGGSIVITSSVAGVIGSPGLGPYIASKHAVIGLMKTAAVELAPSGIRVNTVNPGPIDNRMMRSIENQAAPEHGDLVKAGFVKQVPLGRYGTNEEIAKAALFLASDESSYCTGSVLMADGGFVAV